MEALLVAGKAVLLFLAVVSVALPFVSERRNYEFVWHVWKRFRVVMLMEVIAVIVLMVASAIVLSQVPGFTYGWTALFFDGKSGNILLKPVMEGSESSHILIRLMVPVFIVALAFILPYLARSEERMFRKGHRAWGSIIKQSVKFGLIHCLVGVPLAAGIVLIIAGLFFGLKYKRAFDRNVDTMGTSQAEDEAVMVSTTYHTMYNMVLVGLLLVIALAAI